MAGEVNNSNAGEGGFEADSKPSDYIVVQLDQLSSAQAKRVSYVISKICPNATLIGVLLTPRSWDIRPFVILPEENFPSVIRFLCPELKEVKVLASRIKQTLELYTGKFAKEGIYLEWGNLEGQICYRRKLLSVTLADILAEDKKIDLAEYLKYLQGVANELQRIHRANAVHGHVAASNIGLEDDGKIVLLDAAVGATLLNVADYLNRPDISAGYDKNEFAPELRTEFDLSQSADVYGFSALFSQLIKQINTRNLNDREKSMYDALAVLLKQMSADKPKDRQSLTNLLSLVSDFEQNKDLGSGARVSEIKKPSIAGRMIKPQRTVVSSKPSAKETTDTPKQERIVNENISLTEEPTKADAQSDIIKHQIKKNTLPRRGTAEFKFVEEAEENINHNVIPSADLSKDDTFSIKANPEIEKFRAGQQAATMPAKGKVPEKIAEANAESDEEEIVAGRRFFDWKFTLLLLFLLIALVMLGKKYLGREAESIDEIWNTEFSIEELENGWKSGIPSKMLPTVATAINPRGFDANAEQIIVGAALRGENTPLDMNMNLIRIAYNRLWEAELKQEDRVAVLTLASSKLFKKPPLGQIQLQNLHPAVFFAITAALGDQALSFLANSPASVLEQLSPPIGAAFTILNSAYPNLSCADERVRMLARILTGGASDPLLVSQFAGVDTAVRLPILAAAFRQSELAESILNTLIINPNLQLKNSYTDWAQKFELLNWQELSAGEKLQIYAGLVPNANFSIASIGKMFAHPAPAVRRKAIELGLQTIRFSHPGAAQILSYLKEKPEILDGMQTFRLAQFLENPGKATSAAVKAWLETKPQAELLVIMLLTSASGEERTKLDFAIARQMQDAGWKPTPDQLAVLSAHPEPYTRIFAYTEIFHMGDKKRAEQILTKALSRETDPKIKNLLETNIRSLK
ncbi:MAG: protein kinase [Deltaproteobacteria bacterium]|nr:protein kinase [Deltaproteobacteria bacterium]